MKTRTGTYVGEKDGKVVYYLGIPYAQAPVGDLRWKAPEPLPPSDAVIEAKNFGASAMQVENRGVLSERHRQDEDCLTLNVCVAAQKTEGKRPVLVLFHHGGFAFGGSADPLLDGDNYVKAFPDVVFVTFNYRLGIFGFIDLSEVPGGEAYADASNLGLLDQIAALRWVKENIAAFGGDLGGTGCPLGRRFVTSVHLRNAPLGMDSAITPHECDEPACFEASARPRYGIRKTAAQQCINCFDI